MAILVDHPRWPAHGTHFAHLVSDTSLAELDDFARGVGLDWRAFDHDHYDVTADQVDALVAAGARRSDSRELVARLTAAGLRVRGAQRKTRRSRAIIQLQASWNQLLPQAPALGAELLLRWQEPQRRYHDVSHLFQMLRALEEICEGPVPRQVALAAWFHDAVYQGVPGQDEVSSAALARTELRAVGVASDLVEEVSRLVMLTIEHNPEPTDRDGVSIVDADLSILGQVPGRYQVYLRDVRYEHPRLTDSEFGLARLEVLGALLSLSTLFTSERAQHLWLNQARENLAGEAFRWQAVRGHHSPGEPKFG